MKLSQLSNLRYLWLLPILTTTTTSRLLTVLPTLRSSIDNWLYQNIKASKHQNRVTHAIILWCTILTIPYHQSQENKIVSKDSTRLDLTPIQIVQWSTVRLALTMILSNRWNTKQVDYINAFTQANIQKEIYIEPPKRFSVFDGIPKRFKILKSLFTTKQAPKTFLTR